MRFIMAAPDQATITSAATCGSSGRLIPKSYAGWWLRVMWWPSRNGRFSPRRPKKAPPSVSGPKTISNALAEEDHLLPTQPASFRVRTALEFQTSRCWGESGCPLPSDSSRVTPRDTTNPNLAPASLPGLFPDWPRAKRQSGELRPPDVQAILRRPSSPGEENHR